MRPEYTRLLAGWLGLEVSAVQNVVGQRQVASPKPAQRSIPSNESQSTDQAPVRPSAPRPVSDGPAFTIEREALKCALQLPSAVVEWYPSLEETAFTHPKAREVHEAIVAAGSPRLEIDDVRRLIKELSVDPLPSEIEQIDRYATSLIARLLELDATRRIADVRGRMQRSDPVEQEEEHNQLFAEIMALEAYKKSLRNAALGERE